MRKNEATFKNLKQTSKENMEFMMFANSDQNL